MLVNHGEDAENSLSQTCPSITTLDLGRNLFETLSEIASICSQLDKLQSLKLEYVSRILMPVDCTNIT